MALHARLAEEMKSFHPSAQIIRVQYTGREDACPHCPQLIIAAILVHHITADHPQPWVLPEVVVIVAPNGVPEERWEQP